jgi:hypothetical protein
MIVETPIAPKVPTVMLRLGVFRSPDIATPCVKPVMAGKNRAKATQKASPSLGRPKLSLNRPGSRSGTTPAKYPTIAAASRAITTYWSRVAMSAPIQASPRSPTTSPAATSRASTSTIPATASPKPIA